MLLGPAGLLREIRLNRHADFVYQVTAQVKDERAHRLGAAVNSEDVILRHRLELAPQLFDVHLR